jgi:hypothetical protein
VRKSVKSGCARSAQARRWSVLLLAALGLAACGSDESSTVPTVSQEASGANGPQSAQGTRPPAPDDAISGRPGGPQGEVGGAAGDQGTSSPSASERQQIERTVERYIAALNAHDGGEVCSLLAPGALDGIRLPERRGSCAASLDASIGHRAPGGAPRWLHTRLVDADSVVLVRGGDGRLTGTVVHRFGGSREPSIEDDVVYLRRAGGRWLIVKPSASFYRAIGARDVPLSALTAPRS